MHSFFLPAAQWQEPYTIKGAEARHMVAVLRIRAGEDIRLLDGEGREGLFRVAEAAKNQVRLELKEIITHPRPQQAATLAIGYGRALRRGWLLEKAVELEAAGIWFWQADRSQGKVPDEGKESWFAQMTAGAKQSNNPFLPEIKTFPGGIKSLVAEAEGFDHSYMLWEGDTGGKVLSREQLHSGRNLFILGPEGGFSEREVAFLHDAAIAPVSLGKRVLRWETAALLCLGLSWWAGQGE